MILLAFVLAASAPALDALFPREADVVVEGDGAGRLELPVDVLRECAPDLSDLRLIDAAGNEVPYAVDTGRRQRSIIPEVVKAEVVDVKREVLRDGKREHTWIETYRVKVPEGSWEIVLDVAAPSFVADVRAGEREGRVWRLDNIAATRTSVPIGAGPAERDVTITSKRGHLSPKLAFRRFDELPETKPANIPLAILSKESRDGWTEVEVERPRGLVPDSIVLGTETAWLDREVEVWDDGPGRAGSTIGRERVFRVDLPEGRVEDLEIAVDSVAAGRLRLRIKDRDSPPLAMLAVFAKLRAPALLFDGKPARLVWGAKRVKRPYYDLAATPSRFPVLLDPDSAPAVRLGAPRANPKFREVASLSFAMRAGAKVDLRRWTHRREVDLTPSPDGLTRVHLTSEDAARARDDFGDVRIIDADSKQWPYLLHQGADGERIDLKVSATSRDRRTEYVLSLPAAPLSLEGLEIDSETPFFDRAATVRLLDTDGETIASASGRLTRPAGDPRPASFPIPIDRAHSIVLTVDDGDDAPLALTVRAVTPNAELFVVAPAKRYTLLVGNPEERRPSYEVERVRGTILAADAGDAALGALVENPEFRRHIRWTEGDAPARIGVWVALLAALAVLGSFAVVLARREEKPDANAEAKKPDAPSGASPQT